MFYTWALGNLVLTILNILFALAALMIIALFLKIGYSWKSMVGPFVAFAVGVIGVLVFLVGSDMRLPMTMINYKTFLHIVILATQLAYVVIAIVRMPVYKQQSSHKYYPYQQPYNQHYIPFLRTGNIGSVPASDTTVSAKDHSL